MTHCTYLYLRSITSLLIDKQQTPMIQWFLSADSSYLCAADCFPWTPTAAEDLGNLSTGHRAWSLSDRSQSLKPTFNTIHALTQSEPQLLSLKTSIFQSHVTHCYYCYFQTAWALTIIPTQLSKTKPTFLWSILYTFPKFHENPPHFFTYFVHKQTTEKNIICCLLPTAVKVAR